MRDSSGASHPRPDARSLFDWINYREGWGGEEQAIAIHCVRTREGQGKFHNARRPPANLRKLIILDLIHFRGEAEAGTHRNLPNH
jgi:hypothetical protein